MNTTKQTDKYPFFSLEKNAQKKIALLYLNRPEKRNAMDWPFWRDLPAIVQEIEQDKDIRAVVLAAKGKSFSLGLDIAQFSQQFSAELQGQDADSREKLYQLIVQMQQGFDRIYHSSKVYISAVHKHCIGGGLDLISACDIRLASEDAIFSLRETAVAIVADMGSLNRLPSIIGQGNTRLMAFTGQDFFAQQAMQMGLVSKIFPDQETLLKNAIQMAEQIAANPNLAVRGTKEILNYMDDHSIADGMKYVAAWNAAFLDSHDFREVLSAFNEKRKPRFS